MVCPQTGYGDKSIELNAISSFYGVSTSCITLFDDAHYNQPYAQQTGSNFQLVDKAKGVEVCACQT